MNHCLGFCHVVTIVSNWYPKWQGMLLRVKHAWTCLLRVLATCDFHATVAKGKEEALEPSEQTGFQQPSGFWITMVGFWIPLAGFRIPEPWIPDSIGQNYLDSGFRITLHGASLPLLLPTPTTQFSLDHKRRSRKRNRKKWKRSDSSDSDSVELMTSLTTPIFDFH